MVALSHLVRAASTPTVVLYNAVPSTEVKAYLTAHEPNGTCLLINDLCLGGARVHTRAFRRRGVAESIAA